MLSRFDLNANFWELNPQYKVGFKDLYDKDKTKDKSKSSKIIWGMALLIHPSSQYVGLPTTEKLTLIENDWFEDKEFPWENYDKEIELFKKLCLTKKERYLHEWEKKLDERDVFLSKVPYDENTAEFLDKLMGNTKKLQDQYDKAVEDYYKEKNDTSGKGGAEESLRERLKA